VVAANDELALGVLEVVQAAGLRVPEDLAVTGFDDIAAAQHSTPSLTTVRQDPAALGRKAAHLLLAQLAGEPVRSGIHAVPTALILRHSCGCALGVSSAAAPDYTGAGWQSLLLGELVRQVQLHNPQPFGDTPNDIWPGVAALVQGLDDAVAATSRVAPPQLEQGWREAVALTGDLEALRTVYRALWHAGMQQIAARPEDPAAQTRIESYLDRMYLTMLRAHTLSETDRSARIEQLLRTSYQLSLQLSSEGIGQAQKLGWLGQTPVSWGCLARWSGDRAGPAELTVVGAYARGEAPVPLDQRFPAPAFLPPELVPRSAQAGGPHILALLPIRRQGEAWGVLAIAGPVETQHSVGLETMGMSAALLSAALEREQLLISLASQQDTLRELGSPIIPLLPGVLLMPLVGTIDTRRAHQIIEVLLQEVSAQQGHTVLLDITGVPLVDSQVASSLLRAARAVTLLGARVILVGVRPEMAQSIVGLGIDLRTIATQPTLAAALRALRLGNGRLL
jgi:anti-anti-sigma factor